MNYSPYSGHFSLLSILVLVILFLSCNDDADKEVNELVVFSQSLPQAAQQLKGSFNKLGYTDMFYDMNNSNLAITSDFAFNLGYRGIPFFTVEKLDFDFQLLNTDFDHLEYTYTINIDSILFKKHYFIFLKITAELNRHVPFGRFYINETVDYSGRNQLYYKSNYVFKNAIYSDQLESFLLESIDNAYESNYLPENTRKLWDSIRWDVILSELPAPIDIGGFLDKLKENE